MNALKKTWVALFTIVQVVYLANNMLLATPSLDKYSELLNDICGISVYVISIIVPIFYVFFLKFKLKIDQSYRRGLRSLSGILLLPILTSSIAFEIVTGEYQYLDSMTLAVMGAAMLASFICLCISYSLTLWACRLIKRWQTEKAARAGDAKVV